jgi:hypothetical protein
MTNFTSVESKSAQFVTSDAITSAEPASRPRRFKVARPRLDTAAGNAEVPATKDRLQARIVGFGPMSRITTSFGEVYAQTLRAGDCVRCKDGNFLQIKSVNRMTLDGDYLKYHPAAQPIVIRAGALAPGLPTADLMLAPYQTVHRNQRIPGERFDRAIDAIGRPQVYRKPEPIITYTTFHCGRPATVSCEGVWIDTAP